MVLDFHCIRQCNVFFMQYHIEIGVSPLLSFYHLIVSWFLISKCFFLPLIAVDVLLLHIFFLFSYEIIHDIRQGMNSKGINLWESVFFGQLFHSMLRKLTWRAGSMHCVYIILQKKNCVKATYIFADLKYCLTEFIIQSPE